MTNPTPRKPRQKAVPKKPEETPTKPRIYYIKMELPADNLAVQRLVAEAQRVNAPLATHAKSKLLTLYADPVVAPQMPQYQVPVAPQQHELAANDDDIMASADALLDSM